MRTAVITGGAQGIGLGCARRLRAEGWRVAVLDLSAPALAALEGDADLLPLRADVADEAAVAAAFARIAEWAPDGLDLLFNNAAIAGADAGPVERLSLAEWRRRVDSSLTATFLCARAGIPMLRARRGAMVNMASTRAFQSEPNSEAYAAAKGGIVALTHALAVSLGPEIRVNAIAPGWIETGHLQAGADPTPPEHRPVDRDQHPAGRVGTADDIAAALLWLAGEEAGFVAGQTLVIDGGMTRKMIYAH